MDAVVFGAGQVGAGVVEALRARGHRVRVVRRGNTPVAGAEIVSGDARDPAFAERATRGADVLFHCLNPSAYTGAAWEQEFPVLGEALIRAAVAHDARLVCLDNLYAIGETDGPRSEDAPLRATGRKGRVRVAWDARLRSERGLRWAAGRAADFFGPGTGEQSMFSASGVAGLAQGRSMWLVGDADAVHAFGYVPDVVSGLVALGESGERGAWHLPVTHVAPRELVARLARAHGSQAVAHVMPGWGVRALAPVVPIFRELRETLYQWDRPFLVDDGRFRARFPGLATSLEDAVAATAASAAAKTQVAASSVAGHQRDAMRSV